MFRKVIVALVVIFVLLIASLAVIPYLFKDKLMAIAKKEVNQQINAHVDWTDFGVSIFKDFPNLTLYVQGVSVVNEAPFKGDTLAKIGEVAISANLMSVITGKQIDINSINIDRPNINVKVLKDGTANYNITKPDSSKTPDSKGGSYNVKLKRFAISNAYITYDDQQGKTYASISNLNNKLSGDFTQNNFVLSNTTNIDSVTVIAGVVPYLNKVKVALKIDMDVDQANNKYTFKDNNINLNDLGLGFDGFIAMGKQKDVDVDLKFKAKEATFKSIISLIPAIYSSEFKDLKTTGSIALDGFAKGKYQGVAYPAFGLNIKVDNASFQYPSLPAAVTNVNILLNAQSPGGSLDNAVVDISKFTVNLAADPFSMKLHLTTPISDPNIDAALVGKVDLGGVKNYYPLKGDQLSGLLNLNVTAKGKLSAIEKKQYQDFNAAGTVEVSNLNYTSKDLPKTVKVNDLKLSFSPQFVALNNLSANIGKSDISASGRLDNLLNYIFSKAVLKGSLALKSNVLDLNEFMTADSKTTTTQQKTTSGTDNQSTTTSAQVPANIDFAFDATINKLLYTNMELDNAVGRIIIKDETITINTLKANTLDGTIALQGDYSTLNTNTPKVDLKIGLNKISIAKAATTFSSSEKIIPIAKSMKGIFSTNFDIKGTLDKDLSPDLNTLLANGKIDVDNLEFSNNKVLNTIADKFKQEQFRTIKAKNFMTVVKVVNGKIYVEPFDVNVDKVKMNIYGSHSLTGAMDYTVLMDAPSELIGAGSNLVGDLLAKSPIPGLSANSLPKALKFKIGITGKTTEPTVNFGLVSGGAGSSVKEDVKQKLDDEKKKLQDEALKAKQQAEDKAKAELEKQKQAAQQKAQQEADKLKQQAEQKAKDVLKGIKFP